MVSEGGGSGNGLSARGEGWWFKEITKGGGKVEWVDGVEDKG